MASQAFHSRQPESGETLKIGQKDVALAATPEVLAAATPCYEILIQAKRTNTGRVYIGGATITNADTGGAYLTTGQTIQVTAQSLSDVWLAVSTNGEGVTYLYW